MSREYILDNSLHPTSSFSGEVPEILYRDQYLIAVNKPSALLVHKSPIDKRETRFALQVLPHSLNISPLLVLLNFEMFTECGDQLFREKFDVHRLLLHASSMSFMHPVTKEEVTIHAPLDQTMAGLFEKFGWEL